MKGKSLGMWGWRQKQSSEDGKLGSVQWKQDVEDLFAKSVVSLLRELGISGQTEENSEGSVR